MEFFCLKKYFVLKLSSTRNFPLKEASELGYQDNKGIIYGINCVILLSLLLFLLTIVITNLFMLKILKQESYDNK
jgi:hypothetical protein